MVPCVFPVSSRVQEVLARRQIHANAPRGQSGRDRDPILLTLFASFSPVQKTETRQTNPSHNRLACPVRYHRCQAIADCSPRGLVWYDEAQRTLGSGPAHQPKRQRCLTTINVKPRCGLLLAEFIHPGYAARPWALLLNAFGVRAFGKIRSKNVQHQNRGSTSAASSPRLSG